MKESAKTGHWVYIWSWHEREVRGKNQNKIVNFVSRSAQMLAHAAVSSITILQKNRPVLHQVLCDALLSRLVTGVSTVYK